MWKLKVLPTAVYAYYCYDKRTNIKTNWRKKGIRSSELSANSARKMKRCLQWLVACSDWKQIWEKKHARLVDYRVNHCTLTFHENLKDDNLARKILSSWLEVAKYRWDVRQYVWKAEPQERGAIHFHLSTNRYMPHEEVRYTWNRALRKHRLNNIDDNSIDVHAVTEENDLLNYFADYLTDKEKHEGRRMIKGRRWGSSQDLTRAGEDYIAIDDNEMKAIEDEFKSYSLRNKLEQQGKPIPDFLSSVNYWIVPPSSISGAISNLYQSEVTRLTLAPLKTQTDFIPQLFSSPLNAGGRAPLP